MAAFNSMARSDETTALNTHWDWLRLVPNSSVSPLPKVNQQESVIRLVAGSFAEPVSQIWSGERIKEYLTAPDARRHLWHVWLSSERMVFAASNCMSTDLAYGRLTFLKGRDLTIEAYGHQPPGLAKALSRLGAEARTPEFYRALVRALSTNGAGAKFLQHTPDLSDDLVLALSALPARLITKGFVKLLTRSQVAPEALGFFTWTLSRLETLLGPDVSHTVLKAPNPLEALWAAVLNLPFPKPPWSGTDGLTPITSKAELQDIAQKFENCLFDTFQHRYTVMEILNDKSYFFIKSGEEPVLLEFHRFGEIGWYLQQARGPKNRIISQSLRDEIMNALENVPIFCPIWKIGPVYYTGEDLLRGLEC